jgi:hypothetical protein
MDWQTASIRGKPADILAPADAKFAVLLLHPRGDETRIFTDALAGMNFACCSPHASGTWWSDRAYEPFDASLTAEAYLLHHVVPWMREAWRLPIAAAGVSMGGQAALRLGFKFAEQFPVVAGIASAIDCHERFDEFPELPKLYRNREHCRQDTATLHARQGPFPRHLWFACDPHDPWHPGNERLREKLRAVGAPHSCDLETAAGGHSWEYFNAMAVPMLEFLKAGLEKESRRLL